MWKEPVGTPAESCVTAGMDMLRHMGKGDHCVGLALLLALRGKVGSEVGRLVQRQLPPTTTLASTRRSRIG
jgi:hypothetical protein